MGDFFAIMAAVFQFFLMPIVIYGYTITFWQVLLFGVFSSIVVGFIVKVIRND